MAPTAMVTSAPWGLDWRGCPAIHSGHSLCCDVRPRGCNWSLALVTMCGLCFQANTQSSNQIIMHRCPTKGLWYDIVWISVGLANWTYREGLLTIYGFVQSKNGVTPKLMVSPLIIVVVGWLLGTTISGQTLMLTISHKDHSGSPFPATCIVSKLWGCRSSQRPGSHQTFAIPSGKRLSFRHF